MPMRADEALVSAGLCEDIKRASILIMEGRVICGAQKISKASEKITKPELLRLKGVENEFVSRGAYKLKRAFQLFDISAEDKVCVDIGASTGGFTEVMLKNGARRVYSVDVGYNLLDWKIRSDPRVTVMEKINARFLTGDLFDERPTFGATDVSFISLKTVLPPVFDVLEPGSDFVALVKPQFEAAKDEVGEKGVVRDADIHLKVLRGICAFLHEHGHSIRAVDYSPIKGAEGNIEFLLHIINDVEGNMPDERILIDTVNAAHENLR